MNRLLSLRALLRRLEYAELRHLREHCSELANRVDDLEAENGDLHDRLVYWRNQAERWREDVVSAINEHGGGVGLTVDGHLVAIRPEARS